MALLTPTPPHCSALLIPLSRYYTTVVSKECSSSVQLYGKFSLYPYRLISYTILNSPYQNLWGQDSVRDKTYHLRGLGLESELNG
jgi:hypothetical protein